MKKFKLVSTATGSTLRYGYLTREYADEAIKELPSGGDGRVLIIEYEDSEDSGGERKSYRLVYADTGDIWAVGFLTWDAANLTRSKLADKDRIIISEYDREDTYKRRE